MLRRLALAALFALGLSPAFAQAPPAVPALPDAARLTSYSISGTTCACAVNFQLYGNPGDNQFQDYVEVYLNGAPVAYNDATYGWAITSVTGPLATIPRPITDAVLTFNSVQTGTVVIVGARRPSRTSQFTEGRGVAARDLNQAITDIIAMLREDWDKINDVTGRGLFFAPGNATGPMPLPGACASAFLAFDATGLNPICALTVPSGITMLAALSLYGNATSSTAAPQAINLDSTLAFAGSPLKLGIATASKLTTVDGVACALAGTCTVPGGFGITGGPNGLSISQTQPPYGFIEPVNVGLSASVGSSALTLTLLGANGSALNGTTNPGFVPFRSTTPATGLPVWAILTSNLTITVPSTATLGTSSSNVPFRIWVWLEYNAGVPELVVATCSTTTAILPCSAWETGLKTTTTIGSGATSAGVPYAPTGVSGDALRLIGYAEYAAGLGTAGTWISTPTTLQLMGSGVKKPGDRVQLATNSTTTVGSTSSSSYAALSSGQTLAITPTSTPNLIRVFLQGTATASAADAPFLQIARATTPIGLPAAFQFSSQTTSTYFPLSIKLLDAPGSVSSQTYSVYGKITSGATLTYPLASTGSYLELEEIMGAIEPVNDNAPARKVA